MPLGMVGHCEEFGCAAIMRTSGRDSKVVLMEEGNMVCVLRQRLLRSSASVDEAALFAEPQARRKREICCLSDCTNLVVQGCWWWQRFPPRLRVCWVALIQLHDGLD